MRKNLKVEKRGKINDFYPFFVSRRKNTYLLAPPSYPNANPAERIAVGSEEKVCPAYEKALRPFHRLRAFSELYQGNKNTFLAEGLARTKPKPSVSGFGLERRSSRMSVL